MRREAAHAIVDGVKDQDVKQHFLMGVKRSLNEVVNQAWKLEDAKAAAKPPVRKREARAGA
jgi:hypothetical protein